MLKLWRYYQALLLNLLGPDIQTKHRHIDKKAIFVPLLKFNRGFDNYILKNTLRQKKKVYNLLIIMS